MTDMAKRFIDTGLFRKPSIRAMKAPYKALFIYLLCECDHAGVWDVELDVAETRLGMKLDSAKAIAELGGSVVELDGGAKWWLVDFVDFQYGELNPSNRVHASVLNRLSSIGIDLKNKPLTSPLQGAKDKDKDKDKEKEREVTEVVAQVVAEDFVAIPPSDEKFIDPEIWPTFEDFWNAYDKKRGRPNAEREWAKLSQADREAVMTAVPAYVAVTEKSYRKDPERYLKHKAWKDEIIKPTTHGQQSLTDKAQQAFELLMDVRIPGGVQHS